MQNDPILNVGDTIEKEELIAKQILDIIIPKKLRPNTGRSQNNPKNDGYDEMRMEKARLKRARRADRNFRNQYRMALGRQ